MFRKTTLIQIALVLIAVVALAGCSVAAQPRGDNGQEPESPAASEPETVTVQVYFMLDGGFVAVDREIPADQDPVEGALEQLLAGPTADEAELGMTSWFSEDTAGMLNSVDVSDGVALVDFDDFSTIIPNASSSAGSQELIGAIQRTLFQFDEVNSIDLRFNGDSDLFWNWLQFEGHVIERGE